MLDRSSHYLIRTSKRTHLNACTWMALVSTTTSLCATKWWIMQTWGSHSVSTSSFLPLIHIPARIKKLKTEESNTCLFMWNKHFRHYRQCVIPVKNLDYDGWRFNLEPRSEKEFTQCSNSHLKLNISAWVCLQNHRSQGGHPAYRSPTERPSECEKCSQSRRDIVLKTDTNILIYMISQRGWSLTLVI